MGANLCVKRQSEKNDKHDTEVDGNRIFLSDCCMKIEQLTEREECKECETNKKKKLKHKH